jgi:guanine deaminase
VTVNAFRAAIAWCEDDPSRRGPEAVIHHPDGLLLVEDGEVAAVGAYAELANKLPAGIEVESLPWALITPGFVDCHVHYPQVDAIAAYGAQLLDWLNRHVFPAETAFADPIHARATASFFLDELLRNGTTSALVFGTVHRVSAEALFEAALTRNMRIVGGKALMDRYAPPDLLDTPDRARTDTEALIKAWSGRGRLGYAVTPRFALACSPEELTMAGEMLARHPDTLLHTHLSETKAEIAATAEAFPEARDYVDVYDRFGLVGPRSVFAHGVHLDGDSCSRLAKAGSAVAVCPSSNLFLGSGLFDLVQAEASGLKLGLGTDIGAGTSFSLLSTAGDLYKIGQLRGTSLDPLHGFYLATLGGARALHVDGRVGSFAPGREADFVVLDPQATPLLARRSERAKSLAELLFGLFILADDRAVARTYVAGRLAHRR